MSLREPLWHQLLKQIYKQRPQQRYISKIHRKLGGSLTHLRIVTQQLVAEELIRIIPLKNRKLLELTPKGEETSVMLLNLNSALHSRYIYQE